MHTICLGFSRADWWFNYELRGNRGCYQQYVSETCIEFRNQPREAMTHCSFGNEPVLSKSTCMSLGIYSFGH